MRHIAQKDNSEIPRDDEFKFRDRAQALVNKWHQILNATTHGTNGTTPSAKSAHKEDATTADAEKAEADTAEKTDAMDAVEDAGGVTNGVVDEAAPAVNGNGNLAIEELNGDVTMEE